MWSAYNTFILSGVVFIFNMSTIFNDFFVDINECNGVNNCSQLCANREPGYACSCNVGFRIDEDKQSCNGKLVHS